MDALVRQLQFREERLTSMFRMGIGQFRQLRLRTQLRAGVYLLYRLHLVLRRVVVEEILAVLTALPVPNAGTVDFWDLRSHHVKQTVAYGAPLRSQVIRGAFIKLHLPLNRQLQDPLLVMSLIAARYVKSLLQHSN